jgi:hypothetical protein
MYLHMHARMYGCLRAPVACIPACVLGACLCMSAHACARERRRNATARPLDVCHHVRMCMCECMYVHMCVRVDSMQACASRRVRMPTCAHAHAHRRLHLRLAAARTLVHARTCGYKRACVCRWLGIDGRASVYVDNVYIHDEVYIPIIFLLRTYTCASMWVCTDTLRTQVSMRLCTQTDATRIDGVHVCLAPSVQLKIYVHGHPSIFRCMHFGAASRRACGRAVAAGARAGAPALGCISLRVQLPLRTHRWAYHAHAGACLGHAR